jgi:plastocyanin
MVDVVVSAPRDEIVLPIGETDTVAVFVQNWVRRDDVVDVAVSDTEGWLQSSGSLTAALDDTTGAEVRLVVALPSGTESGVTSTMTVDVVSQADPDHAATTTLTLSAERAALAEVLVAPATVEVAPGDTVRFDAVGLDQFSRTVAIAPTWSATGGEIDGQGIYVAGAASGTFVVTATDPATGLSGTAQVGNGVPVQAEDAADVPSAVQLDQNYPNPFRSETTIAYTVPQATHVRLAVYDVLGREVAVLVDAVMPAGRHTARLAAGPLASGFYLYRLVAGDVVAARPMVLMR